MLCRFFAVALCILGLATSALADVVAREDFDGGAVGVTAGFSPATDNLDDGPGDFFGVGSIAGWPQEAGIPFSLADDSVIGLKSRDPGDAFAADSEAVYGQAADVDNNFFAISDTRDAANNLGAAPSASWTFDISGASDLHLSIDLGGQSDGDSFGGWNSDTAVYFTYSIDGGAAQTAFSLLPTTEVGDFAYRAMDGGAVTAVGAALQIAGDAAVSKLLAEDGSVAADTFLNRSPAAGPGAGMLDTFTTALNGSGSSLQVTVSATVPHEALAFDNLVVSGAVVPEPATGLMLGWISLVAAGLLRRRVR